MKNPLITVTMTTYNHEKYIAEAINSILNQTFNDFELVIVNDGSTDKTEEVILCFTDDRIKYIYQENMGPSICTNTALKNSAGKYIALMSGDDVFYPDRLEKQLRYYELGGPRLLFGQCDFVDENSQAIIDDRYFRHELFNRPNRSRCEILNHFFYTGNYFNGITCFTEKYIFEKVGFYDIRLLQAQDFDMWVKILLRGYDVEIMPDKLIKYRIRANNQNLSAPRKDVLSRTQFEFKKIYKEYLLINNEKFFLSIFPETESITKDFTLKDIPYIILKLAQSSGNPYLEEFAIDSFYESLNEEYYFYLNRKFNFKMKDLYQLTGTEAAGVRIITGKRFWRLFENIEKIVRFLLPQKILQMKIIKKLWYS